MEITHQQLEEIIEKWNLEGSKKQLKEIDTMSPTIKIGFIGKFSSGKTSLINSLLGTKFPININPTTKAICVIESCQEAKEIEYYAEEGMDRKPVSFMDFCAILEGDKPGVAVAEIPPTDVLPDKCVFIDTPGINSLSEQDTRITYNYLSFLDAAILCIDVNEGSINQDTLNFLFHPSLEGLHDRLVIVLTHSDTIPEEGVKNVKAKIVSQLENLAVEKKFHASNIADKIVPLVATERNSCASVIQYINQHILAKQQIIFQEHKQKATRELAEGIIASLQQLQDLPYDDQELTQELQETQKSINAVKQNQQEQEEKLCELQRELEKVILIQLETYLKAFSTLSSDKLPTALEDFQKNLTAQCEQKIRCYLKEAEVPSFVFNILSNEVKRLSDIHNVIWQALKVGIPALLTAGAGAAASLGGNAAEAAGGAIAAGAGEQAAKQVAKQAGKEVVKEAGKEAVKKGFLAKACIFLGKVVDSVNPVTYVEELFGPALKELHLQKKLGQMAFQVSNILVESLRENYQQTVINPILAELDNKQAHIADILRKGKESFEQYKQNKQAISQEIKGLQKALNK